MVIPGMSSSLHSTAFGCQQQVKLQSSVGAVLTPHGCVDAHQKLGLLFCRSPLVSAAGIASGSWSVGDTVLPADGFCGTAHPHLKNSIIRRALRSLFPHPTSFPTTVVCPSLLLPHALFHLCFPVSSLDAIKRTAWSWRKRQEQMDSNTGGSRQGYSLDLGSSVWAAQVKMPSCFSSCCLLALMDCNFFLLKCAEADEKWYRKRLHHLFFPMFSEHETQEEGRTTGTALVLEGNIKAFRQCPALLGHTESRFPSVKLQEKAILLQGKQYKFRVWNYWYSIFSSSF